MIRVSYEHLKNEYIRSLVKRKMNNDKAIMLADAFATMGWEGTYSHGINRFPVFISQVDNGDIDLHAKPEKINQIGVIEQWDFHCGPGPLNGMIASNRSIELAKTHGVGVVALKNSNHWMRGGSYALNAARKGYACIAITNSLAVMPAWGGKDHRIGTNPLIIAIPGNTPVLLDMSCSQYSYGALEVAKLANKPLEVDGGYNANGELSKDPNEISQTKRILPAGYWKGSGLSIVLDMLLTILTGGNSTVEITEDIKTEKAVSQLLITFDTKNTMPQNLLQEKLTRIIDYTKASELIDENVSIKIPGEKIYKSIKEHEENGGMPVDERIWEKIQSL